VQPQWVEEVFKRIELNFEAALRAIAEPVQGSLAQLEREPSTHRGEN